MVTAEELTVAIRSEGVGETQQDLEGVESAMQDTAESAGDSAAQLEGFSERFQGAMSAAVGALAVGAAGLLSQVPVLGEAFSGLAAVVSAVAFQMDGVLRPVLSPLTNALFGLANWIFELEGFWADLVGSIGAFVSIAVVVIGTIATVGAQIGVFASTIGGVISILGTIAGVIASVAAALVSLPAVVAIAIAAIVAFATAYIFNLGGVRDKTNSILGQIWQFFAQLGSDIVSWTESLAADAWQWGADIMSELLAGTKELGEGVWNWFVNLGADITTWASDLASDAFQWGADLINQFVAGIKSVLGTLKEWLSELGDVAASVGMDSPTLEGAGGGSSGGSNGGSGGGGRPRFNATGTGGTRIDGRQLSESTGRYRSDPGRRRGL